MHTNHYDRTPSHRYAMWVGGVLGLLMLACAPLRAADPVGQIFPKPLPATATTYPYMGYLPSAYAAAPTQTFPLILCIPGYDQLGNGTSDGTFVYAGKPTGTNDLAKVLDVGPLNQVLNGSTYFSTTHPAIIVEPQTISSWDPVKLNTTLTGLLSAYRVDPNRIYLTGLSLGGGAVEHFMTNASYVSRIAALAPIAGSLQPSDSASFATVANTPIWLIHNGNDTVVPACWTSGTPSGFSPALLGWSSGIASSQAGAFSSRCLDNHPDHPTPKLSGNGQPGSLTGVVNTYTGRFSTASGWTWIAGQVPTAGAKLQVTIRAITPAQHSGWIETYGSGSSPNGVFWDWLFAQHLGSPSTDGTILAKTTAATGAPYPYLIRFPTSYSANAQAKFPLVLCLGGTSENGDGSSDGTLVEATGNQLARVLHAGPLALCKGGTTYFDDQPAIIVHAQTAATWSDSDLDTLLTGLVTAYRVDTAHIALTGYAQGGGEAWYYARSHPTRLAALAPIAGTNYPGSVARCAPLTGQMVWAFHCSDDDPTPTSWTTGIQSGSTLTMTGWVGGTAASQGAPATSCLDSHPDHPTVKTNTSGGAGSLQGVTATRTGAFAASSGWTWVSGTAPVAGAKLQVTIYFGGGHTGWTQTYGSSAATLNRPFWDWLLGQRQAPGGSG